MKYYEGPKGVSIKKITEGLFKARGPLTAGSSRGSGSATSTLISTATSLAPTGPRPHFQGPRWEGRKLEYLEGLQALAP